MTGSTGTPSLPDSTATPTGRPSESTAATTSSSAPGASGTNDAAPSTVTWSPSTLACGAGERVKPDAGSTVQPGTSSLGGRLGTYAGRRAPEAMSCSD